MTRRTKDELLAEARHLGALWDLWREWRIVHDTTGMFEAATKTSAQHLSHVGTGGVSLSGFISGFRQVINDISHQIESFPDTYGAFLDFYRERTGRDWGSDAGNPDKKARAILRRGRIRNDTEWHLLESILTDVDQTVFSPVEVLRLEAMRREFEDGKVGSEG